MIRHFVLVFLVLFAAAEPKATPGRPSLPELCAGSERIFVGRVIDTAHMLSVPGFTHIRFDRMRFLKGGDVNGSSSVSLPPHRLEGTPLKVGDEVLWFLPKRDDRGRTLPLPGGDFRIATRDGVKWATRDTFEMAVNDTETYVMPIDLAAMAGLVDAELARQEHVTKAPQQ